MSRRSSSPKARTNYVFPLSLTLAAVLLLGFVWKNVEPFVAWSQAEERHFNTLVVDYTVPFDTYREHTGLMWVLNHNKVVPTRHPLPWDPSVDYTGYRPTDRDGPTRLFQRNTADYDLVYLADTYGVYRNDLINIPERQSHMGYSRLEFGGLSERDLESVNTIHESEAALIVEFNSFCDPTNEVVRTQLEEVLGVRWTGWVGRVFMNPHDPLDAPDWLAPLHRKQYDEELPHGPSLVLVHRDSTLVVVPGKRLQDIVPSIELTVAGTKRFPNSKSGAPYYYWFSVMKPDVDTEVYANLQMPESEIVDRWRHRYQVSKIPMMTQSSAEQVRIYFAGDFSDIDFVPGPYNNDGIIKRRAKLTFGRNSPNTTSLFWRFFAPTMGTLLSEIHLKSSRQHGPAK